MEPGLCVFFYYFYCKVVGYSNMAGAKERVIMIWFFISSFIYESIKLATKLPKPENKLDKEMAPI